MSRRRQGVLFSRYSELPSRYTRRVTRTSCHSMPSSSAQSVNVSETSASPTGFRVSAPLKITSAISSPERLGRLLAESPADGVKDVGFSTTVWSDDRSDALVKTKSRFVGKRFKAEKL